MKPEPIYTDLYGLQVTIVDTAITWVFYGVYVSFALILVGQLL